ncbi:tetratricopeptide repeat protein [Streptomyces sp. DSM 44917]|uniref:Tetratricopeptide repeat protein n=1 Tax=Streptomyces boetiae TaxID=3075541 RepID=A0ABU2L736_9ACTN|nr:tetratricopeptide repeat protein [Streptomyces sp. DSM 44917]MDT0307379.1 tetratricopeptide repeat protein [Streptomyces sp. DSM 44917]
MAGKTGKSSKSSKSSGKSGKKKKPGGRGHPGNDLRKGAFHGPVQGSGTQHITYNALSAPASPTALDALPPVPPEFTGRDEDLEGLLALLAPPGRSAGDGDSDGDGDGDDPVPSTAVVAGLPGVGKTSLAVAAGHRALEEGWFTGVQVINLRGYDQSPVQPAQALDALLRSLGVPDAGVPPTPDGRESFYRSRLARLAREGERLLIVLDNASDPAQIRPLLPGTAHHRVVVTSRHTLIGLGARLITLRTLSVEGSVRLLRRTLRVADPGDRRVEEDPAGAEALARACGRLPLALQITGSLLTADPGQPLAERAGQLAAAGDRLSGLDDGTRTVRAVFRESLERTTLQQAELFRLLSLNPGPVISTKAASLLADRGEQETRALLDALALAHLIDRSPTARDRWQMHDLVRDFAAEEARAHAERSRDARRRYQQAQLRLTKHYLRTVSSAAKWVEALPGEQIAGLFASREEALSWLDEEQPTLTALRHTMPREAELTQLALTLASYFQQRHAFDQLHEFAVMARDIARETGNAQGEAGAGGLIAGCLLNMERPAEALAAAEEAEKRAREAGMSELVARARDVTGDALRALGRHEEALAVYRETRDAFRRLGARPEEAQAEMDISLSLETLKRYPEALEAARTSLELRRAQADPPGEARSLLQISDCLRALRRLEEALEAGGAARERAAAAGEAGLESAGLRSTAALLDDLGRYEESLTAGERARELSRELGLRSDEAYADLKITHALRGLGRHEEALARAEAVREAGRETGSEVLRAHGLSAVGRALEALGRFDEAVAAAEEAAAVWTELGDADGVARCRYNAGTALRNGGRAEEAVAAAGEAVRYFEGSSDLFETGLANEGLALALAAAGRGTAEVAGAWRRSAQAYRAAGDQPAAERAERAGELATEAGPEA